MTNQELRRQRRLKRQRRNKKLKRLTLTMLVLVILGLALLLVVGRDGGQDKEKAVQQPAEPQETQLSILCVGDVMSHMPQTNAAYNSSTGTYDYSDNYEHVKSYIESADLALCNVETTFGGTPYAGFPAFSSPDSLAQTLAATGFDVGITANNHMADRGYDGVIRTQEILQQNGLTTVGSMMSPDAKRYAITEVKGIKVGIVAYTYETGSGSGTVSLNGSNISDQTAAHICSFNFATMEEDAAKIKADMDAARAAGAEVLIVYYHWGEEYQMEPNKHQVELAQKTADMGADIIFASHPHVLQKAEYLTVTGSDKKVPVFYSMGNFISNQRSELMGNRYTEEGLMATVDITYLKGTGITSIKMGGIPTWVDKFTSGGSTEYRIIPLDDQLGSNTSLSTSGHLSRAQQALEDANGILGLNTQ